MYSAPAAHGSFPTLSLKIFPWMLDPVPRRFHRVRLPVSSSVVIGLPQRRLGSAFPRLSANHDFSRPVFSRLQIFLNVPASKFARPPDRLYRCAYCRRAAGAFTSGQYRASLPPHAPDMLTVRIQAIDSTGTFTLLDSQPCRLLTFAPQTLLCFIATTGPSVTLSPFSDFPVFAGYTVSFSADFATGRGGLLQLLGASLSSCCRCHPVSVSRRLSQSATIHAAFAPC